MAVISSQVAWPGVVALHIACQSFQQLIAQAHASGMSRNPWHVVALKCAGAVACVGEAVLPVEAQAFSELALAFQQQAVTASLVQVDGDEIEWVEQQLILKVEAVQAELIALYAILPFGPRFPGRPGLRFEEVDVRQGKGVVLDVGEAQYVFALEKQPDLAGGLPVEADAAAVFAVGMGARHGVVTVFCLAGAVAQGKREIPIQRLALLAVPVA